ncbi:MAG: hypothetical protein IJA70_01560, partial [Oscillospiraceae bacterium]|nr:hypothetical protein [Oscillospiraceae bacterium]
IGLDYNPSVAVGDTSLYTREAALRVACNPSSVTFGDTFHSGKADYLGGRRRRRSSRGRFFLHLFIKKRSGFLLTLHFFRNIINIR